MSLLVFLTLTVITGLIVYRWFIPQWKMSEVLEKEEELELVEKEVEVATKSQKKHGNVKSKKSKVKKYKKQ